MEVRFLVRKKDHVRLTEIFVIWTTSSLISSDKRSSTVRRLIFVTVSGKAVYITGLGEDHRPPCYKFQVFDTW